MASPCGGSCFGALEEGDKVAAMKAANWKDELFDVHHGDLQGIERDIAFFGAHVDRSAPGGCWEWIASTDGCGGYGRLFSHHLGKNVRSHRFAIFLIHGRLPAEGRQVCHTCDNPKCVNPTHLYIGDYRTNTNDRVERGRTRNAGHRGSEIGTSKLTEDMIPALIGKIAKSRNTESLGRSLGLAGSTLRLIASGERWQHATGFTRDMNLRTMQRGYSWRRDVSR